MTRFNSYIDEETRPSDYLKNQMNAPKKKTVKKKNDDEKDRLKPKTHKDQLGSDKAHFEMVRKLTSSGWRHVGHDVYVNGTQKGKLSGSVFKVLGDDDLSPEEKGAVEKNTKGELDSRIQQQKMLKAQRAAMAPSPEEIKKKQDDTALKTKTAPPYLKTDAEIAEWYFKNGGKDRRLKMSASAQAELDKLEKEANDKEKNKKETAKTSKTPVGSKKGEKYETIIAGKDKSLDPTVDTSKQKAFTQKLYDDKKGDSSFYEKTKNYKGKNLEIEPKWSAPSWLLTSGRVPVREVQIFTRMMNTKPIGSTDPPISFFTDGGPGGAGKIQAQAGELMTMMCASMSRDERKEFEKSVKEHIASYDDEKSIITKDWLKAAINNSEAIHSRIEKEFGVDDASKIITHTCWDTKDDAEALGLKDYKKNKGFSTDIYIKLKLPNGQTVLNEVSLKKDKNVNFLNSSTGKFKDWDDKLSSDIDPVVYASVQKNKLVKNINKDLINRLLSTQATPKIKELKDALAKNKQTTIDKFMSGSNRESRKILNLALEAQIESGDEKSAKIMKSIKKDSKDYSVNAIKAISTNERLKKGMLDEVKSEFPLKAVTENEETMAIGDMSVDRKTVKEIFGTDKWEEIQEHLTAITDKEPPFLAYKAKGKGDIIPIARINVREDGVGYGGQFKFEMSLDPRFGKLLKKANVKLYSKETMNDSMNDSMIYRWFVEYNLEEDD